MSRAKLVFILLTIFLAACHSKNETGSETGNEVKTQDSTPAPKQDDSLSFDKKEAPADEGFMDTVIEIKTFQELYRNIGSNRTLKIKSPLIKFPASAGSIVNVYNELNHGLIITGITNLKITGEGSEPNELQQPDPSSKVIQFIKCKNIVIENIKAGHGPQKGGCAASVLSFVDCKNVFINSSILYGSGYEGINALRTHNLQTQAMTIRECSTQIMSLIECRDVRFFESNFAFNDKPNGAGKFYLAHTEELAFNGCFISRNSSNLRQDEPLFILEDCFRLYLKDCTVSNNTAARFSSDKKIPALINTTVTGNSWQNAAVQ